jgi:hypothetical protein
MKCFHRAKQKVTTKRAKLRTNKFVEMGGKDRPIWLEPQAAFAQSFFRFHFSAGTIIGISSFSRLCRPLLGMNVPTIIPVVSKDMASLLCRPSAIPPPSLCYSTSSLIHKHYSRDGPSQFGLPPASFDC